LPPSISTPSCSTPPPAKLRDSYANFAIVEPPLKLVLIAGEGGGGTLNHLGVEVANTDEVTAATQRLGDRGLETTTESQVACCYALQNKVWVHDPSGASREVYTVLADASQATIGSDTDCCGPGACDTDTADTTSTRTCC
jgi:hypothetical protein